MKLRELARSVIDVRPEERGVSALMFAYFFLVITSFWVLKPLKKTLFFSYYAGGGFELFGKVFDPAQAEQWAKVSNMFVAMAAVIVFSALSNHIRRERLTYVFSGFFGAAYAFFAIVSPGASGAGVWAFYLMGDLFSTLMVATFFAFLNDSVSSDRAKRLYGVVGLGGVLGGVFGSTSVALGIQSLSLAQWMMTAMGLAVAIAVIARAAAAGFARLDASEGSEPVAEDPVPDTAEPKDNPAIAGARLVLRSRYLLAIVAIVGLYEVVSTMVDFQFSSAVYHLVTDDAARSQHFASIYAVTNWLSAGVQLLLTSFVMRRFGLGVALLILPLAIASASIGFVAAPILVTASLLTVSDNAFSYSINQSSKETLYVPTTTEEKYQAKAFIDMFVQRFAKAIAVGISLTLSQLFAGIEGLSVISFVVLGVVALWAWAAVYAGREFRRLEARESARTV